MCGKVLQLTLVFQDHNLWFLLNRMEANFYSDGVEEYCAWKFLEGHAHNPAPLTVIDNCDREAKRRAGCNAGRPLAFAHAVRIGNGNQLAFLRNFLLLLHD